MIKRSKFNTLPRRTTVCCAALIAAHHEMVRCTPFHGRGPPFHGRHTPFRGRPTPHSTDAPTARGPFRGRATIRKPKKVKRDSFWSATCFDSTGDPDRADSPQRRSQTRAARRCRAACGWATLSPVRRDRGRASADSTGDRRHHLAATPCGRRWLPAGRSQGRHMCADRGEARNAATSAIAWSDRTGHPAWPCLVGENRLLLTRSCGKGQKSSRRYPGQVRIILASPAKRMPLVISTERLDIQWSISLFCYME